MTAVMLNEKYRPQTIEDYVFVNASVERKVRKWVKDKDLPGGVLLIGSPGVGKSTLARVLINDLNVDPADVQVVNGSAQGIDYIRDVIEPWTKKASFGEYKVVLIEEADALPTTKSQRMLRDLTESTMDHVRWIMTGNYVNGFIPALLSRFESGLIEIDSMDEEGVLDFIINIIEEENIIINEDEHLLAHIEAHSPDIRKIINSIQGSLDSDNVLYPPESASKSFDEEQWHELWVTGNADLKSCLALTSLVNQSNYEWFYRVMYENSKHFPDEGKGVVLCSMYLDRAQVSANQRLHLDAFLYSLWMEDDE